MGFRKATNVEANSTFDIKHQSVETNVRNAPDTDVAAAGGSCCSVIGYRRPQVKS